MAGENTPRALAEVSRMTLPASSQSTHQRLATSHLFDTSQWGRVIVTEHEGSLIVSSIGDRLSLELTTELNNVLGGLGQYQEKLASVIKTLPASLLMIFADMTVPDITIRTGDIGRELKRMVTADPLKAIQTPTTELVVLATSAWHPNNVQPQRDEQLSLDSSGLDEVGVLTPQDIEEAISLVDRDLDTLRDRIRPLFQEYLSKLEGSTLESFERNRRFASELSRLLVRLSLRLKCQSCGEPATLQVKRGNTVTGAFVFAHGAVRVNTTHGGRVTIPKLKLIEAPVDSRRRKK